MGFFSDAREGFLKGVSSAFTDSIARERKKAILIGLDPETDSPTTGIEFQYFPDSVSDSKSINHVPREPPGASLPIYQWVSSGERTISFTVVFTCDTDLLSSAGDIGLTPVLRLGDVREEEDVDRGAIARTARDRTAQIIAAGYGSYVPDIRATLAWLRSFTIPSYGSKGDFRTTPPGKLLLTMENSGIGLLGGDSGLTGDDTILCIMIDCGITFESFFPSGLPRVVTVSLSFAQIGQMYGRVRFPSRTEKLDRYASEGSGAGENRVFTIRDVSKWLATGD